MANTIKFKQEGSPKYGRYCVDPLMDKIRAAARSERWTGHDGFKEWASVTYNATLRHSQDLEWTSISFNSEQDMEKFKQDFEVESSKLDDSKSKNISQLRWLITINAVTLNDVQKIREERSMTFMEVKELLENRTGPVLQYMAGDGSWVDVPTVVEYRNKQ